jgi:hypothetical protein
MICVGQGDKNMLTGLLDVVSTCAAMGSVALLAYGALLLFVFQSNATDSAQHTVARLALYESLVQYELSTFRPDGVTAVTSFASLIPFTTRRA